MSKLNAEIDKAEAAFEKKRKSIHEAHSASLSETRDRHMAELDDLNSRQVEELDAVYEQRRNDEEKAADGLIRGILDQIR